MKIVFLDFDGVLNSTRFSREMLDGPGADDALDPVAVEILNRIVERTTAKVVVSSTWRLTHPLERIVAILRAHGFRGEVLGATPVRSGPRSGEIAAWLSEQRSVTSFVILDDLADMGRFAKRHVRTRVEDGLLPEHEALACAVLNRRRLLFW